MEEKLDGIVVGSVNFGESDKILTIFTPDKGVISAKIKGVKKAGAKLKFASEPFCFAEYVFAASGDRRTVISASLIDSFYPIREDIQKFFAAGVIGEFVRKFFKEEMVEEETFLLVADTLKKLAYGDENAKSVLCGFLLKALFNAGYGLNLNGCAVCGEEIKTRPYFDWSGGGFYCEKCVENRGGARRCGRTAPVRSRASGRSRGAFPRR